MTSNRWDELKYLIDELIYATGITLLASMAISLRWKGNLSKPVRQLSAYSQGKVDHQTVEALSRIDNYACYGHFWFFESVFFYSISLGKKAGA